MRNGWLNDPAALDVLAVDLQRSEERNVGIITGAISGLLVLDIDPRNGGDETLRQLESELGSLPPTPTVNTGGGGRHFYFRCPDPEVRSPANALGRGVDIRCANAQVIAPPSMHVSGRPYEWASGCSPDDLELADLPVNWLDRIRNSTRRPPPPPQSQNVPTGPSSLEDADLLYLAKQPANGEKFDALWRGESPTGDRSADDLALCGILAFWCRKDQQRMDRLFRQSARLRPKWDEPHRGDGATYGQMTLERAIETCRDTYGGGRIGERNLGQEGRTSVAATTGNSRGNGDQGPKGGGSGDGDGFAFTDLGNALRLKAWFGGDLRFVPTWDRWYTWKGSRWVEDEIRLPHAQARDVAARLRASARQASNDKLAELIREFAESTESARAQKAMVELAKSDPAIVRTPRDFDRDEWLLNCPNGTLDLRSGTLREHRRDDLITRCVRAQYDANAACPGWLQFLDEIFMHNADLIRYVQQVLGMALTGDVSEQLLWIFIGSGCNGKNVLLDSVTWIMGDYVSKAAPDLLTQAHNDRHPTEVADLCGRRLVIASETDEGRQLAISFMKTATGDATLKARRMRQDFWEFPRTFKLVLMTNNLPRVREESNAVWRRIRIVPFDHVVPDSQIDRALPQKLRSEAEGILAWLVRGCRDWQQNGLIQPKIVTDRSAEYRDREDLIAEFVNETCDLLPFASVTNGALREAYAAWCTSAGTRPLSPNSFTDRIRNLAGVTSHRIAAARGFVGIRLRDPYEAALTPAVRDGLHRFAKAATAATTPTLPSIIAELAGSGGGTTPGGR